MEDKLRKKEQDITIKEKELNIADHALDFAMKKFNLEKDEIEDSEFHQYLHNKLAEVENHDDVMREASSELDVKRESSDPVQGITDLIDECKDSISKKDLDKARNLYNQLRMKYYDSEIDEENKEMLHNMIREIYDEINLGNLKQN